MSETPQQPQISGRMFLFERPELLNKDVHGDFGMTRAEKPFAFCSKVRAIPITISEVATASKSYPVVFSSNKNMVPLAIVGVVDDMNLFVDENGNWDANAYVPGYIRRYPFALATEAGGGDRVAVVIDAAFEAMKEGGEVRLFENGQPTEATQSAIEFCKQYETDRLLTERVLKQLEPFDLVVGQMAQYTPTGQTEQQAFAQYFGVDEKRLNELPDAQLLELRRLGLLPLLYTQMLSMTNWRLLLQKRAQRFNLNDNTVIKQIQLS